MHNHVGHRWIKTFLRKIISILLLYSLFFTNTTNASSVGGWSMGNPIAQGASTIYEGSKNVIINGADYVKKGAATITPSASNVAKTLGKGVAGVALSVAVEQLLGAVDWVLDPANNQIKYKIPKEITCTVSSCNYRIDGIGTFATPALACSAFFAQRKATGRYVVDNGLPNSPGYCLGKLNSDGFSDVVIRVSQIIDTSSEDKEKSIPLADVAAQVISNAESNTDKRAAAQVATAAAAADIVAEAETDSVKARPIAQQLEASSSTKPADPDVADKAAQAQGSAKPNEANPEATDLALEFPAFCGWAPVVCEAAQVVISFPQTLSDWWEAAKDWAKNDENQDTDNEPPEIKEIDIDALDTSTFTGTAGCPSPIVVPISFGDGGETEISYEPICQLAEKWSFVAPMIGFLSGAMIIVGVGRKGEDGEI